MDKGGYSISLVPENGSDAKWFTKETIERFVRFVSTPEILERVYTLESEILQMEEAIATQSSNDVGNSTVEDHHPKPLERNEGSKPLLDSSEEKAIVLYQPGAHPPEANESPAESRLQLKKVLETRRTVLQKEQGMAFARAVAAGFDVDQMAPLMSFAESFGASRMRDACVKFKELWKRKHETGQWVEIEAAEAMCSQPEFSLVNSSGIILANGSNKQWPESSDNNGKAHGSGKSFKYKKKNENPAMDQSPVQGHQGHFLGQMPHPMFSPWPINSPPGTLPVVQGIPMQGIPYYQNYPGNTPFVQQPYPGEDNRVNSGQRVRRRRHSLDCEDTGSAETESWDVHATRNRSQDDAELDNNTSGKGSRSSGRKKKSGKVVIRNINYITSDRQDISDDESQSASGSDDEEQDGYSPARNSSIKQKKSARSVRREDSHLNTTNKEGDDGHWQAFQNYLLKDADEAEHDNGDMFAMEKGTRTKRRQTAVEGDDPLAIGGRRGGHSKDGDMTDVQRISGSLTRVGRGSADESLRDSRTGQFSDGRRTIDGEMDAELNGRRAGYRRTDDDGFIINGHRNHSRYNADHLALNRYENGNTDSDKKSSQHMDDDSHIVPLRSPLQYEGETHGSNAINMDSELSSARPEVSGAIIKYEPDDLTLMPEREMERGTIGYDPALDYDMETHAAANSGKKSKKVENDAKPGPRSKRTPDSSDKKKTVGPIRKGKPSKLSPLDEAKARAEKLRSFKADLQKMKKEREEEEMKRLASLKQQRQKRISSRGTTSTPAQSTPLLTRKSLPTKLSPISHKGSKFSDSEPGPSSPLQRSSIKVPPAGSSSPAVKASKSSKLSTGSQSAGNRLTRSVSSLSGSKMEDTTVTTDTKASMARIRRLSEPKVSGSLHAKPRKVEQTPSSVKPKSAEPASKQKLLNGPETKKISAIVNYDKSKAASLPELKTRTPKASDAVKGKLVATGTTQNENGSKPVVTSESSESKGNDDYPVEKTVVMPGCETSSVPNTLEESVPVQVSNSDRHNTVVKPDIVAEESIQASTQHQTLEQSTSIQDTTIATKEFPKVSNSSVDKPYQAPFARNSSLEDPSTRNSEYGKAPPTNILATTTIGTETLKVRVSDSMSMKLEKIPEVIDKSETKESSKGFRRLLKFGRKSHATNDRNSEVDTMSVKSFDANEGVANTTTSNEAHTLKNLISQDETPTAATTPQKSSRHFSLLSPFRSKTSEKKLTA
ncbi:COP1-interacting protein 7 [Linum perenne]